MRRFLFLYKYLNHFFTARNTGGHGVHSPFIFHFTKYVLNDKNSFYNFDKIEALRSELKKDSRTIDVLDFGIKDDRKVNVSQIAKHTVKSRKYGQLFFRIANYFKSISVLELGTSIGISTSYLAMSSKNIHCVSMEGCPATAEIANQNFKRLGLKNINVVIGNIDETLSEVLNVFERLDLIFFDANHRSESLLNYFDQCLIKVNENSILLIDDIYWSGDMEFAWNKIKNHPRVMSTIDLFQIGVVFFNSDLNKKHYKMRF